MMGDFRNNLDRLMRHQRATDDHRGSNNILKRYSTVDINESATKRPHLQQSHTCRDPRIGSLSVSNYSEMCATYEPIKHETLYRERQPEDVTDCLDSDLLNAARSVVRSHNERIGQIYDFDPRKQIERPCKREILHHFNGQCERYRCPLRWCQCDLCLRVEAGHKKHEISLYLNGQTYFVPIDSNHQVRIEDIPRVEQFIRDVNLGLMSKTELDLLCHSFQQKLIKFVSPAAGQQVAYSCLLGRILLPMKADYALSVFQGYIFNEPNPKLMFDCSDLLYDFLQIRSSFTQLYILQDSTPTVMSNLHATLGLMPKRIFAFQWSPSEFLMKSSVPQVTLTPLSLSYHDNSRLQEIALRLIASRTEYRIVEPLYVTRVSGNGLKSSTRKINPYKSDVGERLTISTLTALASRVEYLISRFLVTIRFIDIPLIKSTSATAYCQRRFRASIAWMKNTFPEELSRIKVSMYFAIKRLDLAPDQRSLAILEFYMMELIEAYSNWLWDEMKFVVSLERRFGLNVDATNDELIGSLIEVLILRRIENQYDEKAAEFVSSISLKRWIPGRSRPEVLERTLEQRLADGNKLNNKKYSIDQKDQNGSDIKIKVKIHD